MSAYDLPPDLRQLAEAAAGAATARRAGVSSLTQTYKVGGRSTEAMDFGAYLAARLPATYAAVARVLDMAATHIPDFAPTSVLDVGSGPGTASWAAVDRFATVQNVSFIDSNPLFLNLALDLAGRSDRLALRAATGARGDMAALPPSQADLVIAAYALAEAPEARAAEIAAHLWSRTDQVLVITEPGTPAGFARIAQARAALIGRGATIAAPCPGNGPCPVVAPDWCHFAVRLSRSRLHMQAKSARVPFEDEPFACLVATRLPAKPAPRILTRPSETKAGVALRLCAEGGINERTVAKREGADFKRAKKAGWGDDY